MKTLMPVEIIEKKILLVRDEKVMLDADLAELHGAPTKAFNQAVGRNKERFPDDCMFQLTRKEKDGVVTNCDHLKRLKYSPNLPSAFTEHGAIMAATITPSDWLPWGKERKMIPNHCPPPKIRRMRTTSPASRLSVKAFY